MTKQIPTREEIIEAWKKADKEAVSRGEKWVGADQIAAAMKISPHWIWKLFAGRSLTVMKEKHGIRLSPQETHRNFDDYCSMLDEAVSKYSKDNRFPAWNILSEEYGIAESTWKKNIGGYSGCSQKEVFTKLFEWLKANKPESNSLEIVARLLTPAERKKTPEASARSQRSQIPSYPKTSGRIYGPRLDFGNLTREPTNEQGVVLLFGMISKYLGFDSIEYVGLDFPDCEAMRKVGNGQHQRVQIEFEFKSRSYNHADPCDVIVCWEHNWEECTIAVIELKTEVEKLRDKKEFSL